MKDIRNIYCVGRNYGLHAAELGNAVPDEPMIFTKPSHALAEMNESDVYLPGDRGSVHFEGEIVIRIGQEYAQGLPIDQLIDGLALGIDFTLRDVQTELKKKGYPWLAAKGFLNSAALTEFIPFPGEEALKGLDFELVKNGAGVQKGNVQEMIFSLRQIVDYIAVNYGIGVGDIIYTGTPAGVGPVSDSDTFELKLGGKSLGSCTVHFKG